MGRKLCKLQCFEASCLASRAHVAWQENLGHWCIMGGKHCNLQCFGASCLARKLGPLVQYGCTVIYSVLGQVVWKEGLGHSCYMARKTLLFSVFWGNLFGKKAWAGAAIWAENTVIFSVLGQVV